MALGIDLSSHVYPTFIPNVDNYTPIDCKYYDFDAYLPTITAVSINIIMLNIRSCKKNFNTFMAFFAQFLACFSCIILTETWLTAERDNVYTIPGFSHHVLYRDHQGGGIKIFVRSDIQSKIISEYTLMNDYFEILTVELFINCKKMLLSALYHPPSSSHINNNAFVYSFTSLLRQLSRMQLPMIICGDFNLNLLNPYGFTYIDEFIHNMFEVGFSPCITIPSKINPENPITKFSLVDHIWVSSIDITKSFVFPVDITDHYPVGMSIDLFIAQRFAGKSMGRPLHERGKATFKMLLSNFNFNIRSFIQNFDEGFSNYFRQIFEIYERAFPMLEKNMRARKPAPWMTLKLKECIKKKAKLYKLYLKGKVSKADYTWYKNRLTNVIRKTKRLYYAKVFLEVVENSKRTWSTINSIMDRKKEITIENMKVNGVVLYGRELANHLNNHFATAAASVTRSLSLPLNCLFYAVPVMESCFFYPTDFCEVLKVISTLKNKGSRLLDISPEVIKDNAIVFSNHLSDLYNLSLEQMVFPSLLKNGRITPVHKSGSTADADNFRPISALPIVSKIFEKLTLNRMEKFISAHSILSPCQFGFRHGKNTTHAIIKLLSNVVSAFHKKMYCVAFFLDLRKAFDTINHRILLEKLNYYGFRGQCHEYVKSYFKDRRQYVYLNGHSSDERPVVSGVPQGSILGPLCFSLFINDLPMAVDADTVLFADDAAFVIVSPTLSELFLKLHKLLNDLNKYLGSSGLVANSSKSKLMIFNSRSVHNLPDFVFSGDKIEWVREFKYLGLTLTNSLSYGKHINNISLNISRITGAFTGIKDFLPRSILVKLFNALALPHLMHHIIIWGSAPAYQMDRLLVRINNLLRVILNVQWVNGRPLTGTNELYETLGILKLNSLYKLCIFKFLRHLLDGRSPELFDILLRPHISDHNYRTRGSVFRHPALTCEIERRFLPHQMIALHDELPQELMSNSAASCSRTFKLKLLHEQ